MKISGNNLVLAHYENRVEPWRNILSEQNSTYLIPLPHSIKDCERATDTHSNKKFMSGINNCVANKLRIQST